MRKERPIVIVGMGPSGLFLVRQLQNITKNIYVVGRKDDVGMFSRYIKRSKRYYANSEETVFSVLTKIYESEKERPTVYLCSDQYLTMFVNTTYNWNEICNLAGTKVETLKGINNKAQISQFCVENNICIPCTIDMSLFCASDIKEFPIVIKWKEKELQTRKNPIGKVLVCKNGEQFSLVLEEIEKSWVTLDMLLVQKFIEGNNDFQYSVGAVYEKGFPLAYTTVKQVKQYPQGISAQVYTINDDISAMIEKIAFDLAKRFNFSGFLETEFKIDQKTGDVYLLDINPRPWGWVSILAAVYADFYRVFNGERPEGEKEDAVWSSPIRKLLSKRNANNVAIGKKLYKYNKATDIMDPHDIMPSFMIYFMAIKKKCKR